MLRSHSPFLLAVCLAVGAGCAPKKLAAADVFGATSAPDGGPAAGPLTPPDQWVLGFGRSKDCAAAAKEIGVSHGRDTGWTYLSACVFGAPFGLLRTLLDDWAAELAKKPNSRAVVARVLSFRSSTLPADTKALQARKVPIYELASAVKQPRPFAGKEVAFLARADRAANTPGKASVTLLELVPRGPGAESAEGAEGASAAGALSESGLEILVKLREPDPRLAAGRPLLVIGRFEGLRVTDDETEDETRKTVLLTLLAYQELNGVR